MNKGFNIPTDLVESINKNECILFVASGLSRKVVRSNAKPLPDWSTFLKELLHWAELKRVPFNSDPAEILQMIEKWNHLMAAEELQELINANEFGEFLNSVFRDKYVKPTKSHEVLTKIPFRAILTTNYDSLIEGAYTISSGGQIPKTFTQLDLTSALSPLRKKDFFVFKMHGDIDRPETIILGTRSYNNLMYKSPEYLSFLETLFTTHTVLFIGFGGSDPDLDYLLDRLSTIFSRTLNKHFILAPNDKFNFTERRRLLLDRRLEVIEYDPVNNHEQVDVFIEHLQEATLQKDKIPTQNQDTEPKQVNIISANQDNKIEGKISAYIDKLENIEVVMWSNLDYYFDTTKDDDRIKGLIEAEEDGFVPPRIAIVLITKNSLKSIKFEQEVELALLQQLEEKINVIPIVVGDIEIPYKLRNYMVLKISEKMTKNELSHIEKAINTVPNKT